MRLIMVYYRDNISHLPINKYLNEQKAVAVEEPTEVISAVEEGDIQKPIEQLKPKEGHFVETATEVNLNQVQVTN